jgi:tRNA (guanine-N7-)-methyltransferase
MKKEQYKYKLFGRFKGRKKNNNPAFNLLNNFNIDIKKDINQVNYNILDIGSGSGENAIHLSKLYSKAQIITCELFEDGNLNLCNQIILKKIRNISLFKGNVLEFLDILNQKSIFDEIWILFPDPWPKVRHHKRRLINDNFLKFIYFFIKKNGSLIIASDSQSYNRSIVNMIYKLKHLFFWENQNFEDWNYDLLDLPKTKFYKKALKSNRNSMIFRLNKI